MTYTWIDYLIIAIFILSMLIGLKRGFIREAISLATIVAAFFIAINFSAGFAAWLNGLAGAKAVVSSLTNVFGESNVSDAVSLITFAISFFTLFLLTMVVGELINRAASGATLIPGLGLVDHFLGVAFGAIRGFLVCVAVLFVLNMTAIPQSGAWTQSQYLPRFQPAIEWLSNVVKPGIELMKDKLGKALGTMQSSGSGGLYGGNGY